jgi:hypothetical protein
MTFIKIISVMLGLFLALETIDVARLMDRGDKLCRMVKYGLVIMAAKVLIFDAPDLMHIFFGVVIASFFWPRLYQRYLNLTEKSLCRDFKRRRSGQ